MWSISKQWTLDAAHSISTVAEDHKCRRLHGHTYRVRLTLEALIADDGMIYDYGLMAPFAEYLRDELDHRNLNDVIQGPTTAERLASHLFHVACQVLPNLPTGAKVKVAVSETPATWAEYWAW